VILATQRNEISKVHIKRLGDLFLAEVDGEGQAKVSDHREVLGLGVVYQLPHTLVHDRVKERQVVPADLTTKKILEDVTVKKQWTDLVLQETETDDSETKTTCHG